MLNGAQRRWSEVGAWLASEALPLWATAGFDRARGNFVERLSHQGQSITGIPRRLMVQARQLFSYSMAARRGWMPEADRLVVIGARSMVRDYFEVDSRPGWAMSVDDHGGVLNPRRDLYAQAFALLGLASAYQIDPDRHYLEWADSTLALLDTDLAAAAGGYVSETPSTDATLRQNPHMHLLEALLALHEVAPRRGYDLRAESLVALFTERMFQRESGILPELFDAAWKPLPDDAGHHFEPGHHHEWAWLLDRYSTITGRPRSDDLCALVSTADALGRSPAGSLWSRVRDDGTVLDSTARIWPHTEAIKSALTGADSTNALAAADSWLGILYERFIRPAPAGGWHDHIDESHQPLNDYMPASALYHIVCALAEYENKVVPPVTTGTQL